VFLALLLGVLIPVRAFAGQTVVITSVPEYGTLGSMSGNVTGVDNTLFRVAGAIYVPGLGWYSKPFSNSPEVTIENDLTWSLNVSTGGAGSLDPKATIFGAWLVPSGFSVPILSGTVGIPAQLNNFPHDIRERYGRTLEFANRTWAVKDAHLPVGPGPNRFSNLPSDVWADQAGLHLTLHQHDGAWWSTEVTLLGGRHGYGTYFCHTASRTDNLDLNVTFGGCFTFDDYGDERSSDGSMNREIDIGEDSRWGILGGPSTQNAKQPSDFGLSNGANRHQFFLPNLSGNPELTRILVWRPDSLRFITLRGNYSSLNYPPAAVVDEYLYIDDPTAARHVPVPGRERLHINLWLNQTVNPSNPTDNQPVEVVVSDFSYSPAGSQDFSGEGRSDISWYNSDTEESSVWLMNGLIPDDAAGLLGADSGWIPKKFGDFNGDKKADIIWQNTDGSTAIWLMDGVALTEGALLLGPGTGWSVNQLGDFNGDGMSDIIWQHTSGASAIWLMEGLDPIDAGGLLGPGTGWSVVKSGDLNGDGISDLLWQNIDGSSAVWLMKGVGLLAGAGLLGPGTGWSIKDVGDFNDDGKSDIVWQHVDGSMAMWLMDGAGLLSGRVQLDGGTGFSVKLVGDFDGDGKSDILWQHPDGRLAIWLMNGLGISGGTLIQGPGTGWSPLRLGDFNGDGKTDIVVLHTDGSSAIWLMNGLTISTIGPLLGPDTGWSPVP